MALYQRNIIWENVISFETEASLMKKIDEERSHYPAFYDVFLVVRTPKGNWTALVRLDPNKSGYLGRYSFIKV